MKKLILFLTLILIYASPVFSQVIQTNEPAKSKSKLPSVDVKTLDGQVINTSQFKNDGKPIIITFWAMWCVNCLKELKAIQEVYPEWQEETGVKLIAISIDDAKSVDKVKPFVNGKNWDFEVYLDANKDLYRALNVNQVPHTFLINGNGEIVWQHVTYTEGSEDDLFKLIKKVIAGEEITE
jgi:cytochrome c biogenesis protein CcmG, thiol:disulfide interchange protein DsbE